MGAIGAHSSGRRTEVRRRTDASRLLSRVGNFVDGSIILERHLVALPLNAYGRQIKNDAILSLMVFETYVPYVP